MLWIGARTFVAAQLLLAEMAAGTGALEEVLDIVIDAAGFLKEAASLEVAADWLGSLRVTERLLAYRIRALLGLGKRRQAGDLLAIDGLRQRWKAALLEARSACLEVGEGKLARAEAERKLADALAAYPPGWGLANTAESAGLVGAVGAGCILGASGRHALALAAFQRAAKELRNGNGRSSTSLFAAAPAARLVVAFNLAVASLAGSAPVARVDCQAAFDALLGLLPAFPANARLWLRLAEAAVRAHLLAAARDDARPLKGHSRITPASPVKAQQNRWRCPWR